MRRGLIIKTYGDPEITSALVPVFAKPAAWTDVARELHAYLYGACGARGPEYYAAKSAKARAVYGANRRPTAPERILLAALGLCCYAVAIAYRRLSAWNRG